MRAALIVCAALGSTLAACDGSSFSAYSDAGNAQADAAAAAHDAAADGSAPPVRLNAGDGSPIVSCKNIGVERLADLLDEWPFLRSGTEARSFSSFDRTGGNSDGFTGAYSELYANEAGEHVIFDALGPGILDTLWFTGPDEGGAGLALGVVRFYLDDERTARLALPWEEIFRGDRAPFLAPLVADNTEATGAFVSFVPMPYAERLIVTTENLPGFYQAHYQTLAPDETIASFDPCDDVAPAQRAFEAAQNFIPSTEGSRADLDTRVSGAGTLDLIQFIPDGSPTASDLEAARIRITWDNQNTPAVDAPLGSFFGSGLGPAEVRALPLSVGGGVYEARFRMPYWSGFHLIISGLTGKLNLHTSPVRYTRSEAGYFHARYSEAKPTSPGEDFEWLAIPGSGKLVGTVLTIHPASPSSKKWWEGDLRSYSNARRTPGLNGTGHEDDHLGGWSNTFLTGPFSLALHGEPKTEIVEPNGQVNANTTLYRFYTGMNFENGVRHSTEHGTRNSVPANYSGVAFYYLLSTESTLTETDALIVADNASRSAHIYEVTGEIVGSPLTSSFEGREDRIDLTATAHSHTATAAFNIVFTAANRGCYLRRLYDQHHGRQNATVRVDGSEVGDWYTAEENATLRWAERDFFLPPSVTTGKSSARIELIPGSAADVSPWSAAEYRALCIRE